MKRLLGKTLLSVTDEGDGDGLTFVCESGEIFRMFHEQDCCESVYLEDVCGEWEDIIGSKILVSEDVSSESEAPARKRSYEQWTFYKIDTAKGGVTLRWYGTSNGYYSTAVDFKQVL